MIDRQTILVARREFIENARTKTFWIGILSLPLILVLAVSISMLLAGAKEEKSFVVIDRTEGQWVTQALQAKSMQRILDEAKKNAGESESEQAKAEAEARWQRFVEMAEGTAPGHPARDLRRLMEQFPQIRDPEFGERILSDPESLPEAPRTAFEKFFGDLVKDPERAQQLQSFQTKVAAEQEGKFVPKTLADLGIEDGEGVVETLDKAVGEGRIFAYFVIPEYALEDDEGAEYVSQNVTDNELRSWYSDRVTEVIRDRRIEQLGLTKEQASSLRSDFRFGEISVSDSGDRDEVDSSTKAASFAPVAFVYLLWIAIFTAANMLLTNTVEEKSNRLIEVLLSSVSPNQLMTGKILGIGATGLTIVVTWALTAIIGAPFIKGSAFEGVDITAIVSDPLYLGSFIGYFLAGYLLYGAILVAMGSVCNSLKEAQNLMQPVMMLLIVPLLAMLFIVQEPNGTVAKVLTYIPLYTPFLMMNRAGGPPPTWEYVVSTLLIVVSVWFAFRAAAKIFRVGILMTGKPPKIGEIFRWLRAPSGHVPTRRSE